MTSVPPAYPSAGYAPSSKTNVLSIVAFVSSFFVALSGILCGHIALSQIKRTGEQGRGFALAGLIIGYSSLAVGLLFLTFWITVLAAAAGTGYLR